LASRRRFLQEDGLGVLWHNKDATRATLWNFAVVVTAKCIACELCVKACPPRAMHLSF